MQTLRVYESSINSRFIDEAVEALRRGEAIVYPTDTYYALGCAALDNGAVERLCRWRGIDPRKNSLSVVCADISQASEYARIDNAAFKVLKEWLPGPYVFVLPAATSLPKVFKGRREVGVRIPSNAIARTLAEALGGPLLSATAGDGYGEADEAALACAPFAALALDGGTIADAGPSTVVSLNPDARSPELVRQGKGVWPD